MKMQRKRERNFFHWSFSLKFKDCQRMIGDVKKIKRQSFVTHARPAPLGSCKASVTQPEVGRAPLFLRATSSLLPSSRGTQSRITHNGRTPSWYVCASADNKDHWCETIPSFKARRYCRGTRCGCLTSRKSESETSGSHRANLSSPIIPSI